MGDAETKPLVVVTREVKYVGTAEAVERQLAVSLGLGYRVMGPHLLVDVQETRRQEFLSYRAPVALGPIADDPRKLDPSYDAKGAPGTPSDSDNLLLENLQFREQVDTLRRALGFAASVIKRGETWTSTCEAEIGGALKGTR